MDCSRPPVPYMDYFIPSILVAFAASSWGYLNLGISLNLDLRACNDGRIWSWCHAPLRTSTVISPQNAMTATVMFILVGCGILGNPYKMLSCKMCFFLKIAGRLNLFAAKYPTIHDSMCLYSGKVLMTTNDHSHVLLSLWSLKIWKICERWRDSGPKISWMVVSKKWWCLARDIGVCRGFLWKKLANRGDAVYYLVTCCFITRGGDAILQLNNNDKLIQIGYIWSAWNTFLQVLQDFICPTLVSDLLFSPSFSVKSSASHRKIRLDRNVTHRRSLSKRIW